jgi:hypothetical protein
MPNFADFAVGHKDLDDVETDFDFWIFQQLQIVQAALGNAAATFGIDGGGGPGPIFGGAGFDFGENEAIGVAKNQINLAARGAEIGGEKFQALLFEEFLCGFFAQSAGVQMGGLCIGYARL